MTKKFSLNDRDAIVIIGSGAGGGTLANELAQKGVNKIVLLEAGKHFTQDDYENDEVKMFQKMSWLDKRVSAGTWDNTLNSPNMPVWHCKAVGGTTNFWGAITPRIMPYEFKPKTTYGNIPEANLLDWPISYEEIEPYYDLAERKMGVAGSKASGMPPLPKTNKYKLVEFGARKIGYRDIGQPQAINSVVYDGRPACQQIGFCYSGCKIGAKWSTLYTEIPRAIETGRVELRVESMALQIQHDKTGKVTGVLYADREGKHHLQKARIVVLAGNSIESPRLLLNSASSMFPQGLAYSSGQVGRNYISHNHAGGGYSIFKGPVNMFRGNSTSVIVRDEMKHDPSRGFAGGYFLVGIGVGLPFMAGGIMRPGAWGREFTSVVDNYDHMISFYLLGEQMPSKQNRITLHATEKDQYGQPIPVVSVSYHANDAAMKKHALAQWQKLADAAGAVRTIQSPDWQAAHNMGTNRMSEKAEDGVFNKWGQAHDVKNLFVSDGSAFTSGAAANPTLTIVALAIRQSEFIVAKMKAMEI